MGKCFENEVSVFENDPVLRLDLSPDRTKEDFDISHKNGILMLPKFEKIPGIGDVVNKLQKRVTYKVGSSAKALV